MVTAPDTMSSTLSTVSGIADAHSVLISTAAMT
jgi:hypothetical protein